MPFTISNTVVENNTSLAYIEILSVAVVTMTNQKRIEKNIEEALGMRNLWAFGTIVASGFLFTHIRPVVPTKLHKILQFATILVGGHHYVVE